MKMNKFVCLFLVIVMMFMLCSCELQSPQVYEPGSVTKENLIENIDKFDITVKTTELVKGEVPEMVSNSVNSGEAVTFMYELPDISNYTPDVKGEGEVNIEIFVPLENNGGSIREVLEYVANSFNNSGVTLADGRSVSVTVRSLEASLAEEYILNGVYYPKGYIAANELYGILMQENGINVSLISERTFGNTMGIAISKAKHDELVSQYGEVTIATLVKANEEGNVSIGYTNPTNNPTGLNFVVSMLSYFDASNPASMEATTDFSNFQNTVSSVSYSTEQMKKSVSAGIIDAFVIERQAYEIDESLKNDFVFMPFGVRHDNPLYAIDELSSEESEAIKLFSEYILTSEMQEYVKSFGYGIDDEYVSTVADYSGGMISTILEYWKEEKSSGKKIVTFFVADKSGSMNGKKMNALQESLKNAMQYVGTDNKVGLISYDSTVYINLPLGDFSTEQQEYYIGAVESLNANGGTATNNALLVAIKLLLLEQANDPNIKPIIILLSDGYTESGYSLNSMYELIDVSDIPIYTIGYEADVDELQRIAEINQGAFINATSDDVGYILKTLFDAEM